MRNTNIAITRISYLSPDGSSPEAFFQQINEGSKHSTLEQHDPEGYLGKKGLRYLSSATKMYCNLAFKCLDHPNLKVYLNAQPHRFGLYDGSELAFLEEAMAFDLVAKTDGPEYVSPMKAPNTLANASASFMAIKSGITGPNFSVCGGATSSLQALDIACLHIKSKITDYGIVVSTEPNSTWHKAIRIGENRSTQKLAPPHGVGFALTTPEMATWNREKVHARIKKVSSGQKLNHESNADALVRLTENIFDDQYRPKDIDAIIVTGIYNMDFGNYINELWWSLEIENAKVHCPELELGTCESTGGSIGILYAIGLANGRIKSAESKRNQNYIICSIDQTGYCIASLIRA